MDMYMLNEKEIRFIVDNTWLEKFNLTINDILSSKPYSADVHDEMFNLAQKKWGISFNSIYSCYIHKINDSAICMDIPFKTSRKKMKKT